MKQPTGSEIEQLKQRIKNSGMDGIETSYIRIDYEPVGNLMISDLVGSGEYVTRKVPPGSFHQKWKIFATEMKPY